MKLGWLVVAGSLVAGPGCALTFQSYLTDGSKVVDRPCSTSRALPIADFAIMSASLIAAGVGFASTNGYIDIDGPTDIGTMISGISLMPALLHGASSQIGFRRARACRASVAGTAVAAK